MAGSNATMTSQQTKLALGLLAASLSAVMLYYAFKSSDGERAAVKTLKDDDEDEEALDEATIRTSNRSAGGGGGGSSSKDVPATPQVSKKTTPTDGKSDVPPPAVSSDAAAKKKEDDATSAAAAATAELHSKIETIDKRGKALFKSKKYMEAASAFTEALDLIEESETFGEGGGDSSDPKGNLARQVVTLTNNRSAMYEKASLPDLALSDCDSILDRDPGHAKARARKLRILESENRHPDALVEVCAMQLKFMRDNRDKLRMGLPVTPPVPQSKIEDLMGRILPGEIERYLTKIKESGKEGQRPLPSDHTVVQLLQSFTGYNIWMGEAARGGSTHGITKELDGVTGDAAADKAKKVQLLLKRGKRHAYDKKFSSAKDDFEAAYAIAEEGGDDVVDLLEDDTYARLLEWTAIARHLRYDLAGALKLYEQCSDLEPANATLLVKRAGVQMDGGKHDEASTLFETALGLDPDAADALLHRANLNMLRGKPKDAVVDLERCLELRPDHLLARLRLATVQMASEDLDGASKSLDKAEDLDPDSSEVHSYRGEMHFAKGDFASARSEFDRAIACEAGNPTPYVNAALCVMNTPTLDGRGPPDIPDAVRLLEKAVEVDPQFHAAYVHLGQLKLSTATDLSNAGEVVALYDRGLEYCRTAEELKDIVSMRVLTVAQIDAARSLKMETLNMQ
mmetsp:Transcript_42905/g.130569  ORF Transcript_42905/g.130569 Transcript_42905/m.130569 type:complete len:683 (-) Transcript_42905:39-2087(-)